MDWNILINLGVLTGTSVGVYVAIRSDLAAMHERIIAANARIDTLAAETNKAHDRIDVWYRSEPRK